MDYEEAWPALTFEIKSKVDYHLVMADYVEDEVESAKHTAIAEEFQAMYDFALNLEVTYAS
jgi:hypothetical protein